MILGILLIINSALCIFLALKYSGTKNDERYFALGAIVAAIALVFFPMQSHHAIFISSKSIGEILTVFLTGDNFLISVALVPFVIFIAGFYFCNVIFFAPIVLTVFGFGCVIGIVFDLAKKILDTIKQDY